MEVLEAYIEHFRRLELENRELWVIIRQKERDDYAASNALDVAELDAHCTNLALENARLRALASSSSAIRDALAGYVFPDNGYCSACGRQWYWIGPKTPDPHADHRDGCPALLLYPRAALSSSVASPTDTNPTASSDPNPEGNRRE